MDAITALPGANASVTMTSVYGGTSLLPLHHEPEERRRRRTATANPASSDDRDVKRAALLWLVACAFVPPLLLLYGAGALDVLLARIVDRRGSTGRGSRPGMPARYRLAALVLFLAELILVLVVLMVWSVARGGR